MSGPEQLSSSKNRRSQIKTGIAPENRNGVTIIARTKNPAPHAARSAADAATTRPPRRLPRRRATARQRPSWPRCRPNPPGRPSRSSPPAPASASPPPGRPCWRTRRPAPPRRSRAAGPASPTPGSPPPSLPAARPRRPAPSQPPLAAPPRTSRRRPAPGRHRRGGRERCGYRGGRRRGRQGPRGPGPARRPGRPGDGAGAGSPATAGGQGRRIRPHGAEELSFPPAGRSPGRVFPAAGYRVFGDSGGGMRPKNWPMASAAFRSWVVRPRTNGALRGPGIVWPPACTVYRVTGGLPSCW